MGSRRVDPEPIVRLRAEVQERVEARGFGLSGPTSQWTGKHNIVSWGRQSWKQDEIRLGWRKTPSAMYFLDAQWAVPRPEGVRLVAAGMNPGYTRRGLSWGAFPPRLPVVGTIMEGRWRADIIADLEFALAWLEDCSSVAGALRELGRPERTGPGRDSEAYAYIDQYVRTHAPA